MAHSAERNLVRLSTLNGIACMVIGAYHLLGGASRTTPGAGQVSASIDSQERFYATVFAGYGLAWVRAARARPVPATDVVALSSVMALGGVGRVLSWRQYGRPHPLYAVLTLVEFVLPAAMLMALRRSRTAS
jgi:hypothetical protein